VSDRPAPFAFVIAPFTMAHYDPVFALWERSEGIGLSGADSRESIRVYLERNPGSSFVAGVGDEVAGAVLCGHDGRRGYIHHLAVDEGFRRRGVGTALIESCLAALREEGIQKCHVFVYRENAAGIGYWQRRGWAFRTDISLMSVDLVDVRDLGPGNHHPE
jgi:putative acetyltransferase